MFEKTKINWWNIRNRILSFTIIVTAVPAIGLGSLYYIQSRTTLLASAEQEMLATAGQAERELDLWFQERYYELRVLATSYLVTENLAHFVASQEDSKAAQSAREEISKYLALVIGRFTHYKQLQVYDRAGNLVSLDGNMEQAADLPDDWQQQLQQRDLIISSAANASQPGSPGILVAIPILSNDATTIGLLAADLQLAALNDELRGLTSGNGIDMAFKLLDKNTVLLASSDSLAGTKQSMTAFSTALKPTEYIDNSGARVIGIMTPLKNFDGAIVLERNYDALFANLRGLRNLSLSIVALLLVIMGLFAWLTTRGILRPLESLRQSAEAVASGDMEVQLPVTSRDELGIATMAFNQMVKQLREQREALEQLTITDTLTGLMNRNKILAVTEEHIDRYRRFGLVFSLLMIDVDNFKQINDQYGHLAGDAVLSRLGKQFRELTRSIDVPARYGGEEFMILLEGTEMKQAIETAERLRGVVENSETDYDGRTIRFTISIGVSQISSTEQDVDTLIRLADEALYEAKAAGRNRTVAAGKVAPRVIRYPDLRDDA